MGHYDLPTEHEQIEQLKARIAELEQEAAACRSNCEDLAVRVMELEALAVWAANGSATATAYNVIVDGVWETFPHDGTDADLLRALREAKGD